MASGFWFLKDGRGFARRITIMINLMKQIHKELSLMEDAKAFSDYLTMYIFTDDHELNGHGGFYNKTTGESVMMDIDFREFTKHNQDLFWQASQQCLNKMIQKNKIKDRVLIKELKILLDMNRRASRGENPIKLNHMRDITPPTGEKKGPGWENQDKN